MSDPTLRARILAQLAELAAFDFHPQQSWAAAWLERFNDADADQEALWREFDNSLNGAMLRVAVAIKPIGIIIQEAQIAILDAFSKMAERVTRPRA